MLYLKANPDAERGVMLVVADERGDEIVLCERTGRAAAIAGALVQLGRLAEAHQDRGLPGLDHVSNLIAVAADEALTVAKTDAAQDSDAAWLDSAKALSRVERAGPATAAFDRARDKAQ